MTSEDMRGVADVLTGCAVIVAVLAAGTESAAALWFALAALTVAWHLTKRADGDMMREFTTGRTATGDRPAQAAPIKFSVDGTDYEFTPPKIGALVGQIAQAKTNVEEVRALINYLRAGLPKSQAEHLIGRLADYDDPFDQAELMAIYKYLTAKAADRPTSSSAASSDRPEDSGTVSTDGVQREE